MKSRLRAGGHLRCRSPLVTGLFSLACPGALGFVSLPYAAETSRERLAAESQHPVELADGREKVVACGLAAATSFGAEPTVLMVGGVPVALLRTHKAGDVTGFDHCADEAQIRRGLAGHDAAGRVAGVGAVDAETNAANHLPHVVLGEIGVGTTRTAGGTIEALGDTAQERGTIEARRLWMQLKDLLEGHLSPFVWLELTYQKWQIPDTDGQTLVKRPRRY